MLPSISVIVPIYNTEKYLDRCVGSLINQSYKNIEIILVDDGSPDRAPEMCDKYAESHANIKVIHKKNGGLGYARNSGIDAADSDYIAFIDSDDYVDTDYFEKLIDGSADGKYDVVLCGLSAEKNGCKLPDKHIFAGKSFDADEIIGILLPSMLGADREGKNYSGMSACKGIYKLSVINKNKIRFVSERDYISEDAIFDIELYRYIKSVNVISSAGYYYCYNDSSLTHSYKADRFEQIKKLCKHEIDLCEKYGIARQCKDRIISTFLGNLRAALKQEAAHYMLTEDKSDKIKFKNIINDKYLQSLIRDYNYSGLPKKQKIYCVCIKHRLWRTALLLAHIQNRTN